MDFSEYANSTAEWEAYLASNPKLLVDGGIPSSSQSLDALRDASNKGRVRWSAQQVAAQGLEGRFRYTDFAIPVRDGTSIPFRCYSPVTEACKGQKGQPRPAYVHLHGGGYLNGSLDTETSVCGAIAAKLDMVVLHPVYRHTNEVHYPVPYDDVWDAFEWIFDNVKVLGFDPDKVVIGGQSAGSGLAAATVLREVRLAEEQSRACRVAGQVLTIPWLMHPDAFPYHNFAERSKTSPEQCAEKTGLSTLKLGWFASLLHASDPFDRRLNPGLEEGESLHRVPKAAFLVAGGDPLRDQGLLYARSLEQAKISTKVHIFPAVPHTFRSCDGLPSARLFVERLLESIAWVLDSETSEETPRKWQVENA